MKKYTLIVFLYLMPILAFSQTRTVTGKVIDEDGFAASGVVVEVVETGERVITDELGNYEIEAENGQTLSFSSIGLESREIQIGDQSTYDISLATDAEFLGEVVVVGYGVQSKREVTGAISQVKGEELATLATPSFDGLLAGRATGVQVTTQNGIIGETPRFRIRGIASITSGTYPLFVVDGVPVYTGDVGGYATNNALGDINPNDIESIEILKDGSATAIYGSRAANGVVLITTKKGTTERVSVNYNNFVGAARPVETFDLLGTADFITISNEKRSNRNQEDWAAGTDFNTDWQDAVLRSNAFQQNHHLSISGASAATNYYFSVGYMNQDGISLSNDLQRFSFKTNLDQQVKDWFKVGMNAGLTKSDFNGLNTGTNSLSGNIFNASRQAPNIPIYNADHPSGYNIDFDSPSLVGRWNNNGLAGDNIPNLMYALENNVYGTETNRLLGNFYAELTPIEDINFRTQIGVDQSKASGLLYWSPVHGDGSGSNGRVQNNNSDLTRWNWQNILTYDRSFNDVHNLTLVGVSEYQKENNQEFFATGTDLSNEFFNQNLISNSYGVQGSGGGLTQIGFVSYAGRLNYNFNDKYFIQASIRRDGLSRLAQDRRWGTFPGASVGWAISEEPFFAGLNDKISDLKLRGSFGRIGNVNIGSFPYLGLYSAARYADTNGIAFSQFGNDQLQWETSEKYDIGLDMGIMDNLITVTADYFVDDTKDLILDVPTPYSFGIPGNSYSSNIGDIKNKGFEFAVDSRIFAKREFNWNLGANISFINNEVINLTEDQNEIIGTNTIIREGEPINSLYGYRYWGVNPANGNPVYYKADGSLVQGNIATSSYAVFNESNPSDVSTAASLSSSDRTILGRTLPKYFGAINSNMAYKNFDLSFLARFSGGNKIFNATRRDLLTLNFNNNSTEILGRWQSEANPGDGMTPKLWASGNTFVNLTSAATTRFVEDGGFLKLDNITLGYTLPSNVTNKLDIQSLRIFAQGQGLVTITDYRGLDPEMEAAGVDLNGTPRTAISTFGLNLKF